ncbi:hypothetical protein GCM10010532_018800 [Dactylosporangium siamense]|uniref:KAP NTPase domain-containing protein n=2 Tax=Dactylosporangium siamense TaxID=685454 RepID=A0A919PU61_9ACTN|nr:hypothetical protein Dsi01nite_066340 [Dactylosporangium siamense]
MPGLLSDNPISNSDQDRFGYLPYVEELYAIVRAADVLPVTVGVFGPWGSGKSSFMRMWRDRLGFAPEDRALWFDPWKYDQKVEVWAALLHSLLAQIQTEEPAGRKAKRLAAATTWLTLRLGLGASVSALTGGLVGVEDVTAGAERIAETDAGYYRDLNRFEVDFAEAVEEYLPAGGRLFVFIDDLDRCTPAAAVSVLEAIKLFLGESRCVFVLGMDYDHLVRVAAAKFGDMGVDGAAYLEKIVQLPFFLPEVSFAAIRRAVAPTAGILADHEPFWALVRTGFGTNPRRVKRFVNVLNLATAVLARDVSPVGDRDSPALHMQLARLLVVRAEHRAFFRHLREHPDAWQVMLGPPHIALPAELQEFADDTRLRRTLGATGQILGPAAPTAGEVTRLLGTIRMAAPDDAGP